MTDFFVLARPYAKAAFEYAQEHQQLTQWSEMLTQIAAYINQPEMREFLQDPRYSAKQRMDLVLSVNENVDAAGKNFLKLLASNNRLTLLPYISELYAELRAAAEKTIAVVVQSVVALTNEEKHKLNAALSQKFASTVVTEYEIVPELLGGLLIQAGDHVIDNSIRGQLERMREALIV